MRPSAPVVGPGLAWWQDELDRVLRKVCKSSFAMDVKVAGLTGKQVSAPEALDAMPKIALPMLLNAAGDAAALFVLDGILIDGLIEQQLLGDVLPTERLDRPVTSIDAGLSEPFVKAVLAGLGAEATGQFKDLTFNCAEQDRAALRLALGEGRYDVFEAEIDMGPGIKTGKFELWAKAVAQQAARPKIRPKNPQMIELLEDCPVELETWLEGCQTTAGVLMSLDVGTVFHIPRSALEQVTLKDCNGHPFAKARLGQFNGARAAKLTKVFGRNSKPEQSSHLAPVNPAAAVIPEGKVKPAAIAAPEFEDGLDAGTGDTVSPSGTALTG